MPVLTASLRSLTSLRTFSSTLPGLAVQPVLYISLLPLSSAPSPYIRLLQRHLTRLRRGLTCMLQNNNHTNMSRLIGGTDSIQRRGDAGAGRFEDAGGVVEVAGWVEAGVGVGAGN
jgi:hypothetical protein